MFHCIQLRQAYPLQVPFFPLFLITYFTFSFQLIFHSRQFWWTIYSINGNRMNELFQLQNPSDDEDLELLLKLLKGITDLSITKLRILDTPTILQHFPYLTQSCYVGAHKFYKWIISYNRFGLVNSWFDQVTAGDPLLPISGVSSQLNEHWIQVVPVFTLLTTISTKWRVWEIPSYINNDVA